MIFIEMMLELVMDMEVDKVADEVADMEVDMEVDWRETKRNDEKQKEMTWSDSSWRFACGDVLFKYSKPLPIQEAKKIHL